MAGAKGASGKTKSGIVNRIYYTQLGLLDGAIHEAAIVYLGEDERTRVRASPSGHRPKIFQIKLLKYSADAILHYNGRSAAGPLADGVVISVGRIALKA
jgi:hypothetical protein